MRLGRFGLAAGAAALGLGPAAEGRGRLALHILVVVVQGTVTLQRRHQQFGVLFCHIGIKCLLVHHLGQQLGDMATEVGRDFLEPLRLAVKGFRVVQIGVVVDLDERLQLDAKALAVIQHRKMVRRDPPGAGVDVVALAELDRLSKAAQLGKGVAPAQGPAAPACLLAVFQDLHLIARIAQFERSRHACQAAAQDQHRGALGIPLQV